MKTTGDATICLNPIVGSLTFWDTLVYSEWDVYVKPEKMYGHSDQWEPRETIFHLSHWELLDVGWVEREVEGQPIRNKFYTWFINTFCLTWVVNHFLLPRLGAYIEESEVTYQQLNIEG